MFMGESFSQRTHWNLYYIFRADHLSNPMSQAESEKLEASIRTTINQRASKDS
jgi:hypothetical protein